MPRRRARYGLIAALLTLPLITACDPAGNTPSPSPSASETTSSATPSASPTSPSPSPSPQSPSPTLSQREQMLHAAQTQFITYYKALVDASRHPTAKPPKKLMSMTVPDGPQAAWLEQAFADAHAAGGRITRGEVVVTVGPETASDGSRRTEFSFRACIDATKVFTKTKGSERSVGWELLDVDMQATPNASRERRATVPEVWKINRSNQVTMGERCTLE